MMKNTWKQTVFGLTVMVTAPLALANDIVGEDASIEEAATWLTGTFNNNEQAAADNRFVSVTLKSCQVQLNGLESQERGIALHVEQAVNYNINRPYRVRLYWITEAGNNVESRVYRYTDESTLIGLCLKPGDERVIEAKLLATSDCSVFLGKENGFYSGGTPKKGCPSSFGGATSTSSEVTLGPTRIDSWDRGFDAAGLQVWGSEAGPYKFRRVKQ
ncbi:MAG: chromophore lyase CpcT/CpeT [Pseudobdellovibrionaceae bacterium]|nr:chromophore lyase CpcT/CpeT [Pseudobdellovibrionaceae bacterium]